MTGDEQRDGWVLREQLDGELAGVHATARARKQLRASIADLSRDRHRVPRSWGRLGPAFAVPLAVVAVVAAVVSVPVFLRAGSARTQPAGPASRTSVSAPPTAGPSPTAVPSPVASTAPLKVIVIPRIVKSGQRVVLKGSSPVDVFGLVRVDWGDGGSSTLPGPVPCGRTAAQNQRAWQELMKKEAMEVKQGRVPDYELGSINHVYVRAGQFGSRIALTPCRGSDSSEKDFKVTVIGPPAIASSPAAAK